MIPGLLPAQLRDMTPKETDLLIRGWNDAQADHVAAPTDAEYEALLAECG